MDATIKAMKEALDEYGAGFISLKIGNYTIMMTNDEEGAEYLSRSWDRYVEGHED